MNGVSAKFMIWYLLDQLNVHTGVLPAMTHKLRIDYSGIEPEAAKPLYRMGAYLKTSGIELRIRDLVYIRASQINGCAFCLDMHTQDARAHGESEQRINCISAWRDSPFFNTREKMALEITEVLTLISESGFSDELYNRSREVFDEHEFVALVMAVNVINSWNRLMVSCGGTAGMYASKDLKEALPGYYAEHL